MEGFFFWALILGKWVLRVKVFEVLFLFFFFRLFSVEGVIISERYCKIILVRHQRPMRIFQLYIFIVSVLTYLYIYSTTCIRTHVRWVIRPVIWLVVWIRSHGRWVIRPVIWWWFESGHMWGESLDLWFDWCFESGHMGGESLIPVILLVVWIGSHVRWVIGLVIWLVVWIWSIWSSQYYETSKFRL